MKHSTGTLLQAKNGTTPRRGTWGQAWRVTALAGAALLAIFAPDRSFADAGCGSAQYNLSKLINVTVTPANPVNTNGVVSSPCGSTCPVSVRLFIHAHVDTAADQTEDITWVTDMDNRKLVCQAARTANDNYFQGADIYTSIVVRVTPNIPITLRLTNTDGDSVEANQNSGYDTKKGTVFSTITSAQLDDPTGASCPSTPGGGGPKTCSALFGVNLGLANYDVVAGTLGFHSDLPDASLVTPAGLQCNSELPGSFTAAPDVEAIVTNGAFRQFRTPACFADIVTNNPVAYEIRFYGTNQVGAKVGGLYSVTGVPYVVWCIASGDGSTSGSNLVFREIRGSSTNASSLIYAVNGGIGAWSLFEGEGAEARAHTRAVIFSIGVTNVILDTVCDAASNVVTVTRETRADFGYGPVTLETVIDPDGLALTNRWWYDASGHALASQQYNGSWQIHYYDPEFPGLVKETLTPWFNSPLPVALIGNPDAGDHAPYRRRLCFRDPAMQSYAQVDNLAEEYLPSGTNSILVAREREAIRYGTISRVQYVAGGANLVTVSSVDDEFYRWTIRPDGTALIFQRVDDATNRLDTTWEGIPNSNKTAVVKGTKIERRSGPSGRLISEKAWSVPENYLVSSKTITSSDIQGRPTRVDYLDGTYELFNYTCCGIGDQRSRDGTWTHNTYDSRKRLISQSRSGVVSDFTYDAADRQVATWQWISGARVLVSSNTYDRAGRLTASTDALGRTTAYAETNTVEGFMVRTTTNPDGSTSISRSYLDGQSESAYGTAVHPSSNEYGLVVSPAGFGYRYSKSFRLGPNGETNEWTMSLQDMAGRSVETIFPDGAFSYSVYDTAGHLIKSCDPDGVVSLFAYNDLGEQEYSAVDMNRSNTINLDGPDRVTRTVREYALHGTTAVQRVTSMVYDQAGSATPLTNAVQESSFDTRENWSISFGLTNYSVASMLGDTNISRSVSPDGCYAVSVAWDGRQQVSTNFAADGTVLASSRLWYDDAGRQVAAQDAFGILSSNVYNEAGQVVASILQAPGMAPRTNSYSFDNMGRMVAATQPDGGVVSNSYFATGEQKMTWGSRTYPVAYTWDSQGRMATLQTFTNFAASNGIATTTWTYHPQRGYLTAKTYQDGKGPTYSYTPAGRLATRTWARGAITTYQYGSAGDLAFVSYSDGTPTVANTFDRLGRTVRVQDGSGERVMGYSSAGQQLSEVHTNDIFAGLGVQRQYDAFLRLSGLGATVAGSGAATNQVAYSYDAASRLSQVAFGTNTVTYGYITNRSLIGSVTFHNGASNLLYTSRQFDGLGQLTNIYSTVGGQVVSGHAYGYSLAGQRTNCVLADGSFWDYGYDVLGQVTNGTRRLASGAAVAGESFGYAFDDIGNRKWADRDSDRQDYTANLLNEYTARTVPGALWVQGSAATNAGIAVNGVNVDRQGTLFSRKVSVDNSAEAAYALITVTGTGTNGATVVTNTVTGHAFTPKTPEVFSYDLDGNLIADGRWSYTWDAENRLIAMQTDTNKAGTAVPAGRLLFTYDSQWRRIRKQAFAASATNSESWILNSDSFFAYDGWNLIHEERRPDALTRRVDMDYAWGLDLSGSMQSAGGIGGLLGETCTKSGTGVPPAVSLACYDANGNLSELVNVSNGATTAHYEYSPFGETLVAVGPAANANAFKCAAKYQDGETGLYYYGYRYYMPQVGRWVSRDPIEERGGNPIYVFNRNDAIARIDRLGKLSVSQGPRYPMQALFPHYRGGYYGWITINFDSPPQDDITIVQEVTIDRDIMNCDGSKYKDPKKLPAHDHFFEYMELDPTLKLHKDIVSEPNRAGTCGSTLSWATIRVFATSITGDLSQWPNDVPGHGHYSINPPSFWTSTPANYGGERTATDYVKSDWNDCCWLTREESLTFTP